jgi:hypothetical protein
LRLVGCETTLQAEHRDTIRAMAGALWGLVNGAERLPRVRLERRDLLVDVATRMLQRHSEPTAA